MTLKKAIQKLTKDKGIKGVAEDALEWNLTLKKVKQMDKLKQFSVGDVINVRDYDGEDYEIEYYWYENNETEVEIKHAVVYVDSEGFPHYVTIEADGSLRTYASSALADMEETIDECAAVISGEDYDVTKSIFLDPDFIDATILQDDNYKPLAMYEEAKVEKDKDMKEDAIMYWNFKEHNRKLRMYTETDRGRERFYNTLDIGSTVFTYEHGEMVVKIKQDYMIVFDCGMSRLITLRYSLLGDYKFYSQEPEVLPNVSVKFLLKYKPKKK